MAVGLPNEVVALARSSYESRRTGDRSKLAFGLKRIQAQAAADGFAGGQAFSQMVELGKEFVYNAVLTAADEVERAATSHGVRFSRRLGNELATAVDTIVGNDWEWARATVAEEARIHSNSQLALNTCDALFRGAETDAKKEVRAKLEHFAAQRKTALRRTREELLTRSWVGAGGAIVGAVATYFLHH